MAISKIQIKQEQGNLFTQQGGQDHISALVFDVTNAPTSGTNTGADGDIYEVFSLKEAEALGFKPYDASNPAGNYENGVPHYHIAEYFRMKPNGHLFIGVKNMALSGNFNFIAEVQRRAQGNIRQLGVYTRQRLFTAPADENSPYVLNLVADLQNVAELLEQENMPLSIVLQANATNVEGTVTSLTRLPSILSTYHKVSVLLGQGNSQKVRDMQAANGTEKAVIGCLGTKIGCISNAQVGESTAWVQKFNIAGGDFDTVALGFGDTTDASGSSEHLANNHPIESMEVAQLDALEDKGYIFPLKYTGNAGTYFSSDRTASDGDFRTISRNRAIDKAKRLVRMALLPTLNESLLIDGQTGNIAYSTIKRFKTLVENALSSMRGTEISDFEVFIDPNQNVLATDTLVVRFAIVPLGTNKHVLVEVGFTQKLG